MHALIAEGFHIYAQTQPEPFVASRIELDETDKVRLAGPFTTSADSIVIHDEDLQVELQKIEYQMTWIAPLQLSTTADPKSLRIFGHIFAQLVQHRAFEARRKQPVH